MYKKQDGFAHLGLIIGLIVLLVIFLAGYRVYSSNTNKEDSANVPTNVEHRSEKKATGPNGVACASSKPGLFTADVTSVDSINLIQNPIRVVGGSNIKTHSFIEVSERSAVYAPMDATLTGGANYYETAGHNPVTKVQYLLSFNDGCDVSFWLDHIVDVPDKIKVAFPAEASNDTRSVQVTKVKIKAGELVGYSNQEGRARFDFGVINLKAPETSLATNPKYKDDPIVKTSMKYRHAVCPYNFYGSSQLQKYQSFYDSSADKDQEIIDDICKQ